MALVCDCCGLNVYVHPPPPRPNSHVEVLTLHMMVFGGGAFGQKGGVLTSEISALVRRDAPEIIFLCSGL